MTRAQLYQRERIQRVVYVHAQNRIAQDDELPACCSTFGCARKLSLPESLAGDKCTGCMNTKPINITNTIKRP